MKIEILEKFIIEYPSKRTMCYKCKCLMCGSITKRVKRDLGRNCRCTTINNKYSKKHNYNENLFETLTPTSSYILGLMYSDGNLSKDSNTFTIGLKKEDKYLLEVISKLVKNNTIVKESSNAFIFYGTNKKIYNDLLHWGLYPNKSLTLTVHPDLVYNADFWRGMIDGDGSVSFSKKGLSVNLCGTQDVCENFKAYCKSIGIVSNAKVRKIQKNLFAYSVWSNNAILLYKNIYSNVENNLLLLRKQKIFLKHNLLKDCV